MFVTKETQKQVQESKVQESQKQDIPLKESSDSWSIDIIPQTNVFEIPWKDIWKYRDLLRMLVIRDFVAVYKQTILGPLWHFIQPVFQTIIFVILFSRIARLSTDGIPPVLFYLSGLTIWNYFTNCFNNTSNTFIANAGIFGKVYFPRLIMPLSVIISNLVKFGIQFLMLTGFIIYYSLSDQLVFHFTLYTFLIPLLVGMMAFYGLGMGIIVSSLTTKYRDLTVLVGFGVQLMMYMTPVVYPVAQLSGTLKKLIHYNPFTAIVEGFRIALFGAGNIGLQDFLYSGGILVIVLSIGLLLFNQIEKSFMDTV